MMFTLGQTPLPVEELVLEYAQNLGRQDPLALMKKLSSLGITNQEDLTRILRDVVRDRPIAVVRHIQDSGLHDQSALTEIIAEAAAREGVATSNRMPRLGIKDPLDRARIASAALSQDRRTLGVLHAYQLPDDILRAQVLKPFFDELTSAAHAGRDFYWLRNFLHSAIKIGFRCQALNIEGDHAGSLEPHERLARVATSLRGWYDGFTDELCAYRHEVQAEELIADALAATIVYWHTADVARYGNRARASLAALTGYESVPSGQMSSNSRRELYGVVLSAYHMLGADLAKIVPVDLGDTARALRLITLATAIKGLDGELPIVSSTISSPEQYDRAEQIYLQRAVAALKKRLGIGSSRESDAMIQLWEFWGGDLTPLIVLAGRCNARSDWKSSLPILSTIATRCIHGSFYDWRYKKGENQLAMLDDRQLQSWRSNPTRIALHTATEPPDSKRTPSIAERATTIVQTKILNHLPRTIAETVRSEPLNQTAAESLLQVSEQEFSRLPLAEVVRLLQHVVSDGDDARICRVAKLINGAKARLLKDPLFAHPQELSDAFKALHELTKGSHAIDNNQYYVISAISDHPKLLLTHGDLVQAGSCLNYRSGPQANSLIDAAIDGNVKLALSYVVKASVFERTFGKNADVAFDPATQSIITHSRDKRLELGYAARREVLCVVTVDNQAACLIEQPEAQNHLLADSIHAQQGGLIADYLTDCGISLASEEGFVRFPEGKRSSLDGTRHAPQKKRARGCGC